MTNLTVKFQIIDEISAKLDELANSGESMVDALDEISYAAESAFGEVKSGSAQAAQSVDGVATAATYAGQQGTQMGTEIADAAQKATEETEKLVEETERVGEESEEAGDKGADAMEALSQAFATVGIAEIVKEAAEAVYELSSAFSEAEKTIIGSTGATAEELDALMDSATRVFSSSNAENLNQVAAAMSSVKKTTGLIGDELERTTSYALSFEDVLGYDVAQSAQTAGALMKNFSISAEKAYEIIAYGAQNGADKNGDMLDVLNEYSAHYAALGLSADAFLSSLIEGAEAGVFSVDKVGDAVKEFNIRAKDGSDTTANAFQMLGLDADAMSSKFAMGGEMASDAFATVVSALNSMDDPMEKNTAAVALFGTMYEDLEANILPVLGNIEAGTIDMHDALDTVANDAKSLDDRWTAAGNSMSTAFSVASPVVSDISETFAELVHNAGDYLQQNPDVAKAITAIGVGIGVATAAITGCVAITKVAIPLIHSFGTAFNSALGPIGWIAIGITAVTAAVTAFNTMSEEAEDETHKMTAATRAQYIELQELETEYQDACDTYGETSEEASRLRYQVDDLSVAFEQNQQTIEEFVAECQEVVDGYAEMVDQFDENQKAIDDNEIGTLALVQKLDDLADGTYTTADSQAVMQAIIDELNSSIEGLNLTYGDVIRNQDEVVQGVREMAQAEAERARQQEKYDEYVKLLAELPAHEEALAAATIEAAAAQEQYNQAYDDYLAQFGTGMGGKTDLYQVWKSGTAPAYNEALEYLNELTAEQEVLQKLVDDAKARMAEIEKTWEENTDATGENKNALIDWQDAAQTAFDEVQTDMEELVQEYGEVYEAALSSLEGQFGLFDEASMKSEEYKEATVKNAQEALDSQLAYWESYSENLDILQGMSAEQLGTTEENYAALLSLIQDGSAESAGLAANMVKQIEKGNEDAVAELADTLGKVQAEREEIATSTAEWLLDFDGKMDELTQTMEETVDGLQLDDEAAAAAKATIQAYADEILAQQDSAVDAATQVANAVAAAFNPPNISQFVSSYNTSTTDPVIPVETFLAQATGNIPGYAGGTTYSEDVFLAGEEGPELIVGHEGSTVFPTTETDRIIDAVSDRDGTVLAQPAKTQDSHAQEKTIRLEIAGSGAVNVGAGTSKEEIVELLYANLKPVLMSIVHDEVFEEGDNSYDF